MNYLPDGFDKLQPEKPYISISKLPEGEYKFRIVQRPIGGWIDWKDKKPYRYRPDEKPTSSFDPEKPIKSFWTMYVWDYSNNGLYIMEVTQMGIIKALTDLGTNEDWGDFTKYDVKIKKEGSGKETKYSVMPVPHKEMAPQIKQAVATKPINLEILYKGGDPWKDLDVVSHAVLTPTGNHMNDLITALRQDNMNVDFLEEYVEDLSSRKSQPAEKIISSALNKDLLPRFKSGYITWLTDQNAQALTA